MSFRKKKQPAPHELSSFCEQLAMITGAGIPAGEGVALLLRNAPDEASRHLFASMAPLLDAGEPLYQALDSCHLFPSYMIHMIKLGEQTGHLEDTLSALAHYYAQEEKLYSGIRNAIFYPLLMTVITLIVLIILVTKVLPVFQQVYQELGSGLNGFALLVMKISSVLSTHILLIVLVIAAFLLLLWLYLKSGIGQRFLQKSKILTAIATGRFANCMAMMLGSGVDSTQGIRFAEELADNCHLSKKIRDCRERMEAGNGLYESILAAGIFSPPNAALLSIGIRTGNLEQSMNKISENYDEEASGRISRLISVLEPTLVIILSLVIGIIIISFLLPLVEIMSHIG